MSDLENELRMALRRRAAPEGFAERVVSQAVKSAETRQRRASVWRQWAVAASLTVALGAGVLQHERAERTQREGQEAKEALVTALSIAGSKLAYAQSKVIRNTEPSRKSRI